MTKCFAIFFLFSFIYNFNIQAAQKSNSVPKSSEIYAESIIILGPIGVGKSTFANYLLGHLFNTRADLEIEVKDPTFVTAKQSASLQPGMSATEKIQSYLIKEKDQYLNIWDTPGEINKIEFEKLKYLINDGAQIIIVLTYPSYNGILNIHRDFFVSLIKSMRENFSDEELVHLFDNISFVLNDCMAANNNYSKIFAKELNIILDSLSKDPFTKEVSDEERNIMAKLFHKIIAEERYKSWRGVNESKLRNKIISEIRELKEQKLVLLQETLESIDILGSEQPILTNENIENYFSGASDCYFKLNRRNDSELVLSLHHVGGVCPNLEEKLISHFELVTIFSGWNTTLKRLFKELNKIQEIECSYIDREDIFSQLRINAAKETLDIIEKDFKRRGQQVFPEIQKKFEGQESLENPNIFCFFVI